SGADLVESVSSAPSIICGHREIVGLVRFGRGRAGCGDALVVRLCQSVDHRAMRGCEVKVVAAEILGWKLPVDGDDVTLLARNDFQAAQLFPQQEVIKPPSRIAQIVV